MAEFGPQIVPNEKEGMEVESSSLEIELPSIEAQITERKLAQLLAENEITEKEKKCMSLWNEYAHKEKIGSGKVISKEVERFLEMNIQFIIEENLENQVENHIMMLYRLNIMTPLDYAKCKSRFFSGSCSEPENM